MTAWECFWAAAEQHGGGDGVHPRGASSTASSDIFSVTPCDSRSSALPSAAPSVTPQASPNFDPRQPPARPSPLAKASSSPRSPPRKLAAVLRPYASFTSLIYLLLALRHILLSLTSPQQSQHIFCQQSERREERGLVGQQVVMEVRERLLLTSALPSQDVRALIPACLLR